MSELNTEWVTAQLNRLFSSLLNPEEPEGSLALYFTEDYRQWVDGQGMNLNEFLAHARVLKKTLISGQVRFREILCLGSKVAEIHDVSVEKRDGRRVSIRVIAMIEFRQDKIAAITEMTTLLEGDESDRDLGARME